MTERIAVPAHLLANSSGDHYVLRVVGDSMIDEAICDGDYVIVLKKENPNDGDMIVACVGDETTLKRYHSDGDKAILKSANPKMNDIIVLQSDLTIRGVVVGLMRKC